MHPLLLADELYEIHEAADGHIVAMGRKGEHTFVAIAFDASGNVVGTSSDYAENRDLEYRVYFKQSVRDNGGNIYFLMMSSIPPLCTSLATIRCVYYTPANLPY